MQETSVKINESEGYVSISVNPDIYSLSVVYSASYVFLDKAYVLLKGDPKKEIIIELRLKGDLFKKTEGKLDFLGREFLNELINYSFYKQQSDKNNSIRTILLQRALLTTLEEEKSNIEEPEDLGDIEELEDIADLEDPEGIAIPWEEKYGKTSPNFEKKENCECFKESKKDNKDKCDKKNYIEDPEGIAIPWEEKDGANK